MGRARGEKPKGKGSFISFLRETRQRRDPPSPSASCSSMETHGPERAASAGRYALRITLEPQSWFLSQRRDLVLKCSIRTRKRGGKKVIFHDPSSPLTMCVPPSLSSPSAVPPARSPSSSSRYRRSSTAHHGGKRPIECGCSSPTTWSTSAFASLSLTGTKRSTSPSMEAMGQSCTISALRHLHTPSPLPTRRCSSVLCIANSILRFRLVPKRSKIFRKSHSLFSASVCLEDVLQRAFSGLISLSSLLLLLLLQSLFFFFDLAQNLCVILTTRKVGSTSSSVISVDSSACQHVRCHHSHELSSGGNGSESGGGGRGLLSFEKVEMLPLQSAHSFFSQVHLGLPLPSSAFRPFPPRPKDVVVTHADSSFTLRMSVVNKNDPVWTSSPPSLFSSFSLLSLHVWPR